MSVFGGVSKDVGATSPGQCERAGSITSVGEMTIRYPLRVPAVWSRLETDRVAVDSCRYQRHPIYVFFWFIPDIP
jgi:hypothetical protein